jgi:hypothetical protein
MLEEHLAIVPFGQNECLFFNFKVVFIIKRSE